MKFFVGVIMCSSSLLFSAASSRRSGAASSSESQTSLHLNLSASDRAVSHRPRSKSGGMPSSKSHSTLSSVSSPRSASCLQRVASLKSIKDRLEREKQKLQKFEAQLMPHEKPLYSVLGCDDLKFVQKKPALFDRLAQMLKQGYTNEQVLHTYTAYLRCQIASLSRSSDDLDDSPRLHDVPGTLDEAREHIDAQLDIAQRAVSGTVESVAQVKSSVEVAKEE